MIPPRFYFPYYTVRESLWATGFLMQIGKTGVRYSMKAESLVSFISVSDYNFYDDLSFYIL